MNRVVVVVLERGRARFFDVGSEEAVELPCLHSPSTRGGKFHSDRADSPGGGEHAYHGRLREEERRHMAAVAARLVALDHDQSLELVLAGPDDLIGALRRALPRSLDARFIATAHLDRKRITPAIIQREARRLQADWTQRLPEATRIRSTT
ncbi:MAG TPA: host attachment protein [Gemmatimonadales bacterium]|nr:host attachment protein [Gemmatimonadales bacterium]